MRDEAATETHAGDLERSPADRMSPALVGLFSETCDLPKFRLLDKELTVGRDAGCDLTLEDKKVSRRHARLATTTTGVQVFDTGSHNGTYLDGQRITGDGTGCEFGSVLRIGRSLFLVVRDWRPFLQHDPLQQGEFVGGPSMEAVWRRLERIAADATPVLIEGESGTGKEHCADLVHTMSGRPGKFVRVNCATLPSALAESELFGHAAGAFSGSQAKRGGLFVAAHRGTLFLDEIGELPIDLQPKLLRVIEERALRPVGADGYREVDVRVVAATNRDLDAMVEQGSFRLDLLHRLSANRVRVPPLRKRREEIPGLVARSLQPKDLPVDVLAMETWLLGSWPGNVRQLKNEVSRVCSEVRSCGSAQVSVELLEPVAQPAQAPAMPSEERTRLIAALEVSKGNVSKAARELGLNRTKLYELLTRHSVDPHAFRGRG